MYIPSAFREDRDDRLYEFVEETPFGTLVATTGDGFSFDHLPLLLEQRGLLRGHVARENRLWQDAREDADAVAVFQGAQAYISPNWYPSKQDGGKVVPTWNYVAVHARGRLRFTDDPTWLLAHVTALSARHEADRPAPWRVSDAPVDFVERLLRGIVGFELSITHIEGKWKLGQNRTEADRRGAADGLRTEGSEEATTLARLMDEAG